MNAREAIKRFPFVTEKPNGELDLWNPKVTGDFNMDFAYGRSSGAMLLWVMKETESPFLFHWIDQAWRGNGAVNDAYRQGVQTEVATTILAAKGHPLLARAAHLKFHKDNLLESLASLPFVKLTEQGPDFRAYSVAGDRQTRIETGRYYAAAICRLIQETGFVNFFGEEPSDPLTDEEEEVMLGLNMGLAEVCLDVPFGVTKFQRAVRHFMADDSEENPLANAVNAL